jgi:glycosyl transferase, family 25
MAQAIPAYVINLDRRPDRRDFMARQLDAIGVGWERLAALDAQTVGDARLAEEVALSNHLIPMGRGSQCNACNHFTIMRRLVAERAPAALVLEDDIELSPEVADFVRSADWLPEGIGIVRLEKWSRRASSKLLGPPIGRSPVAGRTICRLHSRIGGSGAYVITRRAAARLLEGKGILRHPIDHLLFNLNISPLAREVGLALVVPALARQAWTGFASDIAGDRAAHAKSLGDRARRGWSEVRLLPRQIGAMLFEGARIRPVEFAVRTS